jgi:WD40 repeat protein/serine/threonine protein kinase
MHVRCPHCQNPIELVGDSELNDITCPSCGSHFSLAADETVSYRPSQEVIGHFQLVERLGAGHFGTVWKAYDTLLHRVVAVKIPRQEQLDAKQTDQFLREARAAAQLRHPNIVSVHEVGRHDGSVYIISDFVEGLTLADWLTGQRPTIREAINLCIKVAEALEHAHTAGITHRDLKPSNIMIDGAGEPHLMDFGLAKRDAGEITMTVEGHVLGTPAYMSPEQARGEAHQADRRSDVYSLGVILFELLTGERPFRGNARMLLHQVIHEEAPSPRTLNATVPRDLETICLKCLEKDPARRYASAAGLSGDLQRFQRREPIAARPISRLDRGWRWCRRNPVIAGLLATVALLLVSGTTVSTYFAILAENETIRANDSALDAKREAIRAGDSARDAKAHAKRADEKTKEAQANALEAKAHADKEADLLRETERQLRVATAERLAGMSQIVHSQLPHLGLALAVESCLATRSDNDELLPTSHQALFDALATFAGRSLTGHGGEITALTISPDDRWLITGNDEGDVRVWDLKSKQPLSSPRVLIGHKKRIHQLDVSRDSRWLASASDDQARVWDLSTGKPDACRLNIVGDDAQNFAMAISPDSRWLVTRDRLGDRIIKLPEDNDPVDRVDTFIERKGEWVGGITFSQNGRWLVSANSSRLWLHDLKSNQSHQVAAEGLFGTPGKPFKSSATISPDSHWLVIQQSDGRLSLWDLTSDRPAVLPRSLGAEHKFTPMRSGSRPVMFSRDGRWLIASTSAAGRLPEALLFDFGAESPRFIISQGASDLAAISSDSRWFITNGSGKIDVIDLHAEHPAASVRALPASERVTRFTISADSRRLAAIGEDNSIRVWNLLADGPDAKPRLRTGHQNTIKKLEFSADGRWVISDSYDGTVRIWDLNQDEFDAGARRIFPGRFVALSPNGRWLVTSNSPHMARLWDLEGENPTVNPRTLMGHQGGINSLAASDDGRWLISASKDKTARVWDLQADDPAATSRTLAGHDDEITSLAISSSSRLLVTASRDRTVRAWNLKSEDPGDGSRVVAEHPTAIDFLSLSGDGRWLLTAGQGTRGFGSSGDVQLLWDLHDPNSIKNPRFPRDHYGRPQAVAISPDERWLAENFGENSLRVWDMLVEVPLTPSHTLVGHQGPVNCVTYTPDCRWVVTGSDDRTARLWDLKSANPPGSSRVLARHTGGVTRALFTVDGRWLVTASADDPVIHLCQWRTEDLLVIAGREGANLTFDEWQQFFPGLEYRKIFPSLPGEFDFPPQSESAMVHLSRAEKALDHGDFETALDNYEVAIRLDPGNAAAFNGRAIIGAAAPEEWFRDGPRAVADAEKACELTKWQEPRYLATLAAACAEAGDFKQAVKWQTKAETLANTEQRTDLRGRLELFKSDKPYRQISRGKP